MTVLEVPIYSRIVPIALDSSSLQRILCKVKFHDWTKWEPIEFVTAEGRKNKTIVVQIRNCINCGLSQRKPL